MKHDYAIHETAIPEVKHVQSGDISQNFCGFYMHKMTFLMVLILLANIS